MLLHSRKQNSVTFNFYVDEKGKLLAEVVRNDIPEKVLSIKNIPSELQTGIDDEKKKQRVIRILTDHNFMPSGFDIVATPKGGLLGGWKDHKVYEEGINQKGERIFKYGEGTFGWARTEFDRDDSKIIADACQYVDVNDWGDEDKGGALQRFFTKIVPTFIKGAPRHFGANNWDTWGTSNDSRIQQATECLGKAVLLMRLFSLCTILSTINFDIKEIRLAPHKALYDLNDKKTDIESEISQIRSNLFLQSEQNTLIEQKLCQIQKYAFSPTGQIINSMALYNGALTILGYGLHSLQDMFAHNPDFIKCIDPNRCLHLDNGADDPTHIDEKISPRSQIMGEEQFNQRYSDTKTITSLYFLLFKWLTCDNDLALQQNNQHLIHTLQSRYNALGSKSVQKVFPALLYASLDKRSADQFLQLLNPPRQQRFFSHDKFAYNEPKPSYGENENYATPSPF